MIECRVFSKKPTSDTISRGSLKAQKSLASGLGSSLGMFANAHLLLKDSCAINCMNNRDSHQQNEFHKSSVCHLGMLVVDGLSIVS